MTDSKKDVKELALQSKAKVQALDAHAKLPPDRAIGRHSVHRTLEFLEYSIDAVSLGKLGLASANAADPTQEMIGSADSLVRRLKAIVPLHMTDSCGAFVNAGSLAAAMALDTHPNGLILSPITCFDDMILATAGSSDEQVAVVMFPFGFVTGKRQVFAIAVSPLPRPGLDAYGNLRALGLKGAYAKDGTVAAQRRFHLTLQDLRSNLGHLPVTWYVKNVGRLREESVLLGGRDGFAAFMESLQHLEQGSVTKTTTTHVYDHVKLMEPVVGVIHTRHLSENTVVLHVGWYAGHSRQVADNIEPSECRLVAETLIEMAWVRIVSHGVAQVVSWPAPIYKSFMFMTINNSNFDRLCLGVPALGEANRSRQSHMYHDNHHIAILGHCLKTYEGSRPEVYQTQFTTSQEASNLVGNVYYANYAVWQMAAVDAFVQQHAPELYQPSSGLELTCLKYTIEHTTELMPFDSLKAVLTLRKVYDCGFEVKVEFFKVSAEGVRSLAAAVVVLACLDGRFQPCQLPNTLAQALLHAQG